MAEARHTLAWACAAFASGSLLAPAVRPAGAGCLVLVVAGCLLVCNRRVAVCVPALVLVGLGLTGANLDLLERCRVREARKTAATGIVGSDPDRYGRLVLRFRGARLLVSGLPAETPQGSRLAVTGVWRPPPQERLAWFRSRRLAGTVTATEHRVLSGPPPPARLAGGIRDRLREAVESALPGEEGALLLGLLVGDTAALPERRVEEFRSAGLSHLLAVSGSNLVLVIGGLLALMRRLPTGRRTRLLAGALVTALFVIVTRAEPSVVRAAVMAYVAFAARWFGVVRDPGRACACALLGIGTADPLMYASIGFQLSSAATVGILVLGPRLRELIPPRTPAAIGEALTLTVAAQVAVMPFLVLHFGSVGLAGLVVNIPAVPLAGMLTLAGAVGAVGDLVGVRCLWLLRSPLSWLLALGHIGSGLPLGSLTLDLPTLFAVGCLTAASAIALRKRRPAGVLVPIAVLFLAGLPIQWVAPVAVDLPECAGVAFLEGGQGRAVLVRGEDGVVLVDTGPDGQDVLEHLRRSGVTHLDALVLTRASTDRAGGAEAILDGMDVDRVLVSRATAGKLGFGTPGGTSGEEGPAAILTVGAGTHLRLGGIGIRVLWPPAKADGTSRESALVIEVELGGRTILLLSDVPADVQRRLSADIEPALVVGVAHEGSADQYPALYEALRPRLAVVPVGRNRYGHPAEKTLALLARTAGQTVRTDVDGTIVLCTDREPPAIYRVRYARDP